MSSTVTHHQSPQLELDWYLLSAVLLLLGLGLIMVYSASIAVAESKYGENNIYYFLIRQIFAIILGAMAGMAAFRISLRQWRVCSPYLLIIGLVLLLIVLIPGIGLEVNGSRRWLPLVVFNFQPSELMKLLILLFAADYVVRKNIHKDHFSKGFFPILLLLGVVSLLLLGEPDYGAMIVIVLVVSAIMFIGGMNLKILLGLFFAMPTLFVTLIMTKSYRLDRLLATLDPWGDPFDKGYQLTHALMAFGLGEWWGVGLGGSVEKLNYLPEAHTDFMFAVLAEEFGFVGVATIIALFSFLLIRAFRIGRGAAILEDQFGALVAQGIGVWLATQAFINMGVNMGIVPTKGLTLPFMSYGGSSIVISCITIAILLRVDWENRQRRRGFSV
ncbi:putative peptidoglycan glycosyltransferase FtsW [Nitrosomonas stercoris]|uniref:Probable peptidoglycan glycosyltransferase FtsW n=1 Tax=Nitrosomonas stercoris TaxID=1444684 RepID=A0A4Y1YL96_9PROT|nr:putative peptidoglycan glycosyltransferase FtsW [Nitrosomonas stercoris]